MTVMYGRGKGASKWDMDGLVGGSHHSDRLLAEAAPPDTVHQLVPQEADTDSDVLACLSTPNTIHLDILFCHSNVYGIAVLQAALQGGTEDKPCWVLDECSTIAIGGAWETMTAKSASIAFRGGSTTSYSPLGGAQLGDNTRNTPSPWESDAMRAYSNFADYMELVVGVEGGGRGRGSVKAILRGLGVKAAGHDAEG
ncbi:hypothetical protein B0H10DRAFT_1954541 [Mycena sp. CBHHK59/15]|nr:hypothetical protein B0H10DRAFT_1954541 [Mycena sp. CBHHK59/15]